MNHSKVKHTIGKVSEQATYVSVKKKTNGNANGEPRKKSIYEIKISPMHVLFAWEWVCECVHVPLKWKSFLVSTWHAHHSKAEA